MKKSFFAGLVALLPVIVTYIVIVFGISMVTRPFEHLVRFLLSYMHFFDLGLGVFSREQLIYYVSKLLIIVTLAAFIFLVGMFAHWVFFHSLGYFVDSILRKIPLIKRIYGPSKDLVDAIFMERPKIERSAALVPYPSFDQRSVGIVTGEYVAKLYDQEETYVCVFVPSTPNATAGYLCNFVKKDIRFLEMSGDEALKFVMSLASTPQK